MARAKGGLGAGLDSLFQENATELQSTQTLRLSELEQNRTQPRKKFDDEAITELAKSIQQHGMLQPIVVRPTGEGRYQIVAGERRWRAAKRIGLTEVPVIIRTLTDSEVYQIALIENLQRENLNPIEEAVGYRTLMQDYDMTQEDVAKIVGRSRSAVANALRLLNLPKPVQDYLENGSVTVGHAKALAAIKDEALLLECARRAAEDRITVREIEQLAQKQDQPPAAPKQRSADQIFYEEMEIQLADLLGRKVQVQSKKKTGTLTLEFYNREDLQALCEKLTNQ